MAESKIGKDFVIKEKTVATATNSNVSPYGAYAQINPTIPDGYVIVGSHIQDQVGTGSSSRYASLWQANDIVYMVSRTASTYKVRFIYAKL